MIFKIANNDKDLFEELIGLHKENMNNVNEVESILQLDTTITSILPTEYHSTPLIKKYFKVIHLLKKQFMEYELFQGLRIQRALKELQDDKDSPILVNESNIHDQEEKLDLEPKMVDIQNYYPENPKLLPDIDSTHLHTDKMILRLKELFLAYLTIEPAVYQLVAYYRRRNFLVFWYVKVVRYFRKLKLRQSNTQAA